MIKLLHEDYRVKINLCNFIYIEYDEIEEIFDEIVRVFTCFNIPNLEENIEIKINWGELQKFVRQQNRTAEYYSKNIKFVEIIISVFWSKESKLEHKIIRNLLYHYVELTIYYLFLLFPISCPGTFNLWGSKLEGQEKEEFEKLRLSNEDIDLYEIDKWPNIEIMKIEKTWMWFKGTGLGKNQVANNNIQKILFGLLYVAEVEKIGFEKIIWYANILEGIYDTPKMMILEKLIDRIFIVLGKPGNHKQIKKEITKFYDIRSRYIHGDYLVIHPLGNELLDARCDDFRDEIIEIEHFISRVVTATIQYMIKNNIYELRFEEKLIM